MLYVQQSLMSDEEVLFAGKFHWMYNVSAISWIFIGALISFAIIYAAISLQFEGLPAAYYLEAMWDLHPFIRIAALISFLLCTLKCLVMFAIKATTEIAVTNRRMVMKRGLISRHIDEMSVDRVEGVIVEQGLLGRIFQYGRVIVRGMGVGAIVLPFMIEDPIALRKAVEIARES